ncbi:MAG: preprotein translocase subunit SecA [Parcubacteria group bacterium]|nr:preprotein translocase subunit SecA [Parcubacteria group bacterium]
MFSFLHPNESYLRSKQRIIDAINKKDEEYQNLSLENVHQKIDEYRKQIQNGEPFNNFLVDVFALTRIASQRTLKQRHFEVQLLGGIALHEGKVIEMKTGEGKTLVATLPASLNALDGKGVHIITVNDYLAQRDTVWMGQIYNYLGLTVGCITQEGAYLYDPEYQADKNLDQQRDELGSFKIFREFLRPVERKEAYQADITYGTNSEFGFDYLRDNLVNDLAEKVQRKHHYAIIDEVDSVLIDEARTPLIISVPDEEASKLYQQFAGLAPQFKKDIDFIVDEKQRAISLTELGLDKAEKIFGFNIFDQKGIVFTHHLETALKAQYLYLKDRDYVVEDGKVISINEFTNRLEPSKRYSGGLNQAIEAKERVPVQQESRTVATITLQNYFRMYEKLAGMTGTALTSAEEFKTVYNMETIAIPTNKQMIRRDLPDRIYKTREAKLKAIVEEVRVRHEKGQPILIGAPANAISGTGSSPLETIEGYLRKTGMPLVVLKGQKKFQEKEGEIIAQAGKLGAITLASNLAGRGVDIVLGGNPPDEEERKKILELGGLHVIGVERNEARRIDNQLRGRSGRQGDPGSSQFFLSLEDDLIKVFAPPSLSNLMERLGWPKDQPIEHQMVTKAIEMAQSKIEGIYFDIRKHILEYDDVINKQRINFYQTRDKILMLGPEIIDYVKQIFVEKDVEFPEEKFQEKNKTFGEDKLQSVFKLFALRILDNLWIEQIERMEALRDSTALRAYGGQDPLVEYKKESYYFFKELDNKFKTFLVENIKNILES